MDTASQSSLDTVMSLMGAMGAGDMDRISELMADDMVWLNSGDKSVPWIGPWEGKEAIFDFLATFSSNFETTLWENEDAFASGDTVGRYQSSRKHATAHRPDGVAHSCVGLP